MKTTPHLCNSSLDGLCRDCGKRLDDPIHEVEELKAIRRLLGEMVNELLAENTRLRLEGQVDALVALITKGYLLPVMVFGAEGCCTHGDPVPDGVDCPTAGFGLCDRYTKTNVAGSDCNRAAWFLMRPSDELMGNDKVRDALRSLLDDPEVSEPTLSKENA